MKKLQRILLVDDDEATNFLNLELIGDLQVAQQVEAMTDAKKALRMVEEECPLRDCPDLILLDLKMPVFDGFDFLKGFQTLPNLKVQNTKVIILTTSNNPRDIQRLQELGTYTLLNKPLTKEKVLSLVA